MGEPMAISSCIDCLYGHARCLAVSRIRHCITPASLYPNCACFTYPIARNSYVCDRIRTTRAVEVDGRGSFTLGQVVDVVRANQDIGDSSPRAAIIAHADSVQ